MNIHNEDVDDDDAAVAASSCSCSRVLAKNDDHPTGHCDGASSSSSSRQHDPDPDEYCCTTNADVSEEAKVPLIPPQPQPPQPPPQQQQLPASAKRMYRSSRATGGTTSQWVTRDIAALDFLLGIPLEAEPEIVHSGCMLLHQQRQLYADLHGEEDHSSSKNENDSTNESINRHHHHNHHREAEPQQQQESNKEKQQQQQQQQPKNKNKKLKWWEKWVQSNHPSAVSSAAGQSSSGGGDDGNNNNNNNNSGSNKDDIASSDQLEQPTRADKAIVAAGTATQSVMLVEGGGLINSAAATATATTPTRNNNTATAVAATSGYTALPYNVAPPGRRLEGDNAVRVQIPLTTNTVTKQKSIARQAAVREWEINTAHGLQSSQPTPMLDGRLFFSASGSYPLSVFSMIRYEPRKEEAALRRQKLEARGGGGSQYVLPSRDWRGISYRSLLPRRRAVEKENKAFNRFLKREQRHKNRRDNNNAVSKDDSKENEEGEEEGDDDASSTSSSSVSSEDSDVYVPGLLDDPEMVLGRTKNVMIGDSVTGPIVASTIQFVEPALLKLELNKQFRERFDGWEPPKSARKYIGAKVIQGHYVLMDPTDDEVSYERPSTRPRQGSVASVGSASEQGGQPKEKQLRMPPSLTLSKIRSLKNQALVAAVRAKLEIGTVALACVYFERLSLDCRVDKSNRRLSFAACLLLATKLNEPNTSLVMQAEETKSSSTDDKNKMTTRLQALVRPNRRSNTMFAALLEFFTQEWNLSLKNLFDAEWGVFAALGFSLLATPSQVAFHFKRLMKTLEWNPVVYLGEEMYNQWQATLKDEEERRKQRERRREARRQRKQEQLLNLRLEIETDLMQRNNQDGGSDGDNDDHIRDDAEHPDSPRLTIQDAPNIEDSPSKILKAASGIKLFNRFSMRRSASRDRIAQSEHRPLPGIPIYHHGSCNRTQDGSKRGGTATAVAGLSTSPSMPVIASETGGMFAINIPDQRASKSETSSFGSGNISDQAGIFV